MPIAGEMALAWMQAVGLSVSPGLTFLTKCQNHLESLSLSALSLTFLTKCQNHSESLSLSVLSLTFLTKCQNHSERN
jgi:hypothetical protein